MGARALFVLCLMTVMVVMVANASPTNMEGGYYNSLTAVGSQCGRGKGGRFHLGKASVAENGDGDGEAQNKGNLSLDPRDLNCTSGSGCVLFNVCGSLSTHTIDLQISNLDADSEGITYVWLSFNGTYAMKRNPKDLIIADLYSSPTKMLGCPPAAPAKNVGSWYIPDGYQSGTPMQIPLPIGYAYEAQLCITPQATQGSVVDFDLYDGAFWMFARSH